jgi:hypothetical protein
MPGETVVAIFIKYMALHSVIGLAIGTTIALLAGAAIGGITQAAPCGAGTHLDSALFGLEPASIFLAPPAAVIGLVIGLFTGARRASEVYNETLD